MEMGKNPGSAHYSEAQFSVIAENYLHNFLAQWGRREELMVGGVNIIESSTASIVLYYLRKAFKYQAMALEFLKKNPANKIHFHALSPDLVESVQLEEKPLFPSQKLAQRAKSFAITIAWYARELSFALAKKPKITKAQVLFICNVARHHDSILPVIKELLNQGISVRVVSKMGIPETKQVKHALVSYLSWNAARDLTYCMNLFLGNRRIKRFWKSKVFKTLHGYIDYSLHKWFESRAAYSLRSLLLAERFISKIEPSVIVVSDVSDYEAKSFTLIGKNKNIPSFCIQYGSLCEHDSEWRFCAQDYVGTFDAKSADVLKQFGIPTDKILLTGNPRFDSYNPDAGLRTKVRNALGIGDDEKFVVFMSIPSAPEGIGGMESYLSQEEHRNMLEAVYGVVHMQVALTLGIKPHPEEDESVHVNMLKKFGHNKKIKLIKNHNSYEIINAADIVVTSQSTTGLEAVYLNKPLLLINLTGRPDLVDYAAEGAACSVQSAEALMRKIEEFLHNAELAQFYAKGRKNYLQQRFGSEKSSVICANVIYNLMNHNNSSQNRLI